MNSYAIRVNKHSLISKPEVSSPLTKARHRIMSELISSLSHTYSLFLQDLPLRSFLAFYLLASKWTLCGLLKCSEYIIFSLFILRV